MKLLIAIMSCARDRGQHQACRDTWLSAYSNLYSELNTPKEKSNIEYAFFMGRGARPKSKDEFIVDAPDDYEHVTEKSRKIFGFALGVGYDYVLHCGRDTYVNVQRLMDTLLVPNEQGGLGGVDYAGNCGCCGTNHFTSLEPDERGWYAYASGGAGSLLSARAMRLIVDSPLYHPADDLLYGMIMGEAGIRCYHDLRFMRCCEYIDDSKNFTMHLSRGTGNYHPRWMRVCHLKSV